MSEVAYMLRVYLLPVLIIGGSILNMLSFAVMRRIRSSITSNYMATLGLVDSGVLIIGGVSLWMHTLDSNFSFPLLSTMSCKLVPFALYSLADLSVFIIVIMTAERFYAVWRPLQASKRGKKTNFKMAMICSIVICAAINIHFVFTHSTRRAQVIESVSHNLNSDSFSNGSANESAVSVKYEQVCIDVIWHKFYEKYWVFIDATIYSFAPLILLTIFNIAIIRYLFKAADESLKLKENSKSSLSLSPPSTPAFLNSNRAVDVIIQHNKANYHSLKTPTIKYKKKSKTLTVSYMKTYFEEAEEDESTNMTSSLKLKRTASNLTTDTALLTSPSALMTTKSIVGGFEYMSNSTLPPQRIGSMSKPTLPAIIRPTRSSSNITIQSVNGPGIQSQQPFKRLNTRITVMLITLNITFCIFSMPMVILQIVYFTFYRFLEATSYYYYTTASDGFTPSISFTPGPAFSPNELYISKDIKENDTGSYDALREAVSHTLSDIPVDQDLLSKVDLIKCIAELLQYLNHSTNFFLYSLSGKTFRNETKAFILHHVKAIEGFFRNKKFKYFLRTTQTSNSNSNQSRNDPERVRLRKELRKLKRQNSFKYSFKTTLN